MTSHVLSTPSREHCPIPFHLACRPFVSAPLGGRTRGSRGNDTVHRAGLFAALARGSASERWGGDLFGDPPQTGLVMKHHWNKWR